MKSTTRIVGPKNVEAFHDVEKTGSWGEVSKKERKTVMSLVVALISGAVILVVGMVAKTKNQSNGGGNTVVNTSSSPMWETTEEKYAFLRNMLGSNSVTEPYTRQLPQDPNVFKKSADSQFASAYLTRALQWTTDDTHSESVAVTNRFVLAHIFFSNGGETWSRAENWLSGASVCNWAGVTCAPNSQTVQELDLSGIGMTGSISPFVTLLDTVSVLWLSDNLLTGAIPGKALGLMKKLSILYLENNSLEGSVPSSLRQTGSLESLFVQGNNLTGAWPEEFCPVCSNRGCSSPLHEFGLDCGQISCPLSCCSPRNNCFSE